MNLINDCLSVYYDESVVSQFLHLDEHSTYKFDHICIHMFQFVIYMSVKAGEMSLSTARVMLIVNV